MTPPLIDDLAYGKARIEKCEWRFDGTASGECMMTALPNNASGERGDLAIAALAICAAVRWAAQRPWIPTRGVSPLTFLLAYNDSPGRTKEEVLQVYDDAMLLVTDSRLPDVRLSPKRDAMASRVIHTCVLHVDLGHVAQRNGGGM